MVRTRFAEYFCSQSISRNEIEKVKECIENPPCFNRPFIQTLRDYFIICYFPSYFKNDLKICFNSQKILVEAVKMYNQEHRIKLRSISDEMVKKGFTPLIPEYLRHPFPRGNKECCYKSLGDITSKAGLFIYCTYHGSVQNLDEFLKKLK
ncbi:MAG: hypothetical protein ACQETH_04375 [Candidatus Rifleibacteriota bacterium]